MFRIACATLFFFLAASWLVADDKLSVEQYISAVTKSKETAVGLSSDLVWKKIRSDRDVQIIMLKGKPVDINSGSTSLGAEIAGYTEVLKDRAVAKEPLASYYYGTITLVLWASLNAIPELADSSYVKDTAREALGYIRFAADAKLSSAMYGLAMAYKNGYGVAKSNLAAADWLTKTVGQNIADGDRESALSNVEEALQLVPDFPAAWKLRAELLGTSGGNN